MAPDSRGDGRAPSAVVSTRSPECADPTGGRLAAQLMTAPTATTSEQVVDRPLAVQGQDDHGFRLAVRARSHITSAADIDDALTRRRTLLVTWLNRRTLHLVARADYWWLHSVTTPQLRTSNERRLRQAGGQ
jgi:hypothetical protein